MEKILSAEQEIDFDLFMTMNYQTFIDKIKKREQMLLKKQAEYIQWKSGCMSIQSASTEFINQLNGTK